MHNTARTISRKVRNTAHSVVKHTRGFVKNHRRAIEITRNVVAIASIALIAIPLVAPVAIPAMAIAIAALGIVEVGLDLAVGDNTSAAVGLLFLFPMSKGFKYVTEIGGDAIKGGSKVKNLYKAEGLLEMNLQKFGKGAAKHGDKIGNLGKLVDNTRISVDWSKYSKHGLERMEQRNVTKQMVENWVKSGKVIQQDTNTFLYLTKDGVAVVGKNGKLVTTYSKEQFKPHIKNALKQLYGE
ncbi:DUF4258 domain-containing protein [Clostridium botulinum]|nr:DUF4258 domain-containing protein [Clostridium botulinum]